MSTSLGGRGDRLKARESLVVMILTALIFVSVPIAGGGLGFSADSLNHHFYLGWVAEQSRFERDFLAASYQSYQYPYSYWPVYKLRELGLSGTAAGIVLAGLQWLAIPAVWRIVHACIPGGDWFDIGMRIAAMLLALMSSTLLLTLTSTANDLLASVPLVWAIAFAITPVADQRQPSPWRAIVLSGACAGIATALKLSNAPLAIALPLVWLMSGATWRDRVPRALVGGLVASLSFLIVYAPWGIQLWREFGNPIYPAYDGLFSGLRVWAGWHP